MIAIIGGGISGLTLAELLHRAGKDYVLFEAGEVPGGKIGSMQENGYLMERGPNSLRLNDEMYGFLSAIGLEKDIVYASKKARKRYVLRNGKYRAIPMGPVSLLFSSFLSFGEKRRLIRERRISPGTDSLESVESFFRRRFGDSVADYLAAPFISGIYAGDPGSLRMDRTFPQLREWERDHGSVIRGAMKNRSRQTHKGIISFREGMGMLPAALAARQEAHIRYRMPLRSLERTPQGFRLDFGDSDFYADAVVSTLPLHAAAAIPGLIEAELSIPDYPPVTVVHSRFRRADLGHALDGFGALHNHKEKSFALGTLFASAAFPGRAPEGEILLTTFVGGAIYPDRARMPDSELLKGVNLDFRRFLNASAAPLAQRLIRWEHAIPQYDGSLAAVQDVLEPGREGLHFGGNWIGGISVWNSMERARELARRLCGNDPWPTHLS